MTVRPVALVTGSGKPRIGWHVADARARRGYALAVHYRTSAAEAAETTAALQGHGVEAVAFRADLADEGAVRALVGAVSRTGPIRSTPAARAMPRPSTRPP